MNVISHPRSRRWGTLSGEVKWWWHSSWRRPVMNWALTYPVDGSAICCWLDGLFDWLQSCHMCTDSHLGRVCKQDEEASFLNYEEQIQQCHPMFRARSMNMWMFTTCWVVVVQHRIKPDFSLKWPGRFKVSLTFPRVCEINIVFLTAQ